MYAQPIEEKIDPTFKRILSEKGIKLNSTTKGCNSSKKSKEKLNAENLTDDKKYDCIVYTKNPQVIRNNGIIINSVLPTFVTASATLKQIVEMAAMKEVTFIAAPEINHLHN